MSGAGERAPLDANAEIGRRDVLFVTLDTLRYDVAAGALADGLTPNLAALLPGGRWERRHTPGSFTYAAHHAFFAGFLPTPAEPVSDGGRPHERLFAARFAGSATTGRRTFVHDEPTWVGALAARGYRTLCVGGVGFFNKQTPLCRTLPGLFEESHWSEATGVTGADSTAEQVRVTCRLLGETPSDRRALLFLNVSALHQPNCLFTPGATEDSPATQAAALAYVDRCLPPLFEALRNRGGALCVLCSDHGTAYGEDGYSGHRLAHEVVWTVPYAEFLLPGAGDADALADASG
ncbi:STM4013/SEN3800 family hydrolase [Alienimonas sp. DA493]|uniref:STM4013/SEN3800 family hydrolase n=1 Tax=Alienimonas sp. DA493 TaxID=3373605 RepID=UPI0037548C4E